jgi:hypothetical protein
VTVAVLVDPVAGDVVGAGMDTDVAVVAVGAAELGADDRVAVEVVIGRGGEGKDDEGPTGRGRSAGGCVGADKAKRAVSKPEPAVVTVVVPPVPWIEYHAVRATPTAAPLPHWLVNGLAVFCSLSSTP